MVVKSGKRLDPLPEKENSYWKHAEVQRHHLKPAKKCKHSFRHVSSREVECVNCSIGFFIDAGSSLKDGHIYYNDKLII